MKSPLRTPEDYELFVYKLPERFPSIRSSSLTFARRGASLARVSGELHFDHETRANVRERLVYDRLPALIDWYGYVVWRGDSKLYWYDSQPHPHEPELQSTHSHHKHVPPDIKKNRIPTPEMSFREPNLPFLIEEIESLLKKIEEESSSNA